MRRFGLIAALVLASGIATVAVAQPGQDNGGNGPAVQAEHVTACADQERKGGAFGECVAEAASAFGRCVAEAAEAEGGKPTEACAERKPGNGGNGTADGGDELGNETGDAETQAADNPTTGLTRPPEQPGGDFGHQVAANAGGNPGGASAERNPTAGLSKPPATGGQEFGEEVSGNAGGGKPTDTPAP